MAVAGISFARSPLARHARIATALVSLSLIAWLITESHSLWAAFGRSDLLLLPAHPVAGLFWLFVLVVFEDRPLTRGNLAPAALLLITGALTELAPLPLRDWMWAARNVAGGLLSLHAVLIIARGWSGDLLETRRRLRALTLGFGAMFAVVDVAAALIYKLDPKGPWILISAGQPLGAAILAVLMVATAVLFLQPRPSVFGAVPRPALTVDPRADALERQTLQRLNELMAAGGWRREGLTIGAVASQIEVPEHRLRRLINQRLGHRNFADFVNSHRIDAAKARLADPAQAGETVAAIAFDLGYGSLGPFNRAFRAATGATPTAWRRQALGGSPDLEDPG
ncbi:helix-turn-helix domain-containing protein [Phenylobacterium aquaticum]|uniref:helix-turn-helix domain-containing protein n=1 Tax=Phenylobacterium aquaticum TaxID=1763816 RepID=UPI001F5DC3EA|nr:helix-turn-helix domain-containing protein [Phenylobacterium aquaticum]MCI3135274.1 helix-turn-helix domain-containing protein [Phenylobacterium aquaticum]